jgi:hypothetical protein
MKLILIVAVWSVATLLAQPQPEAGGNLLLRDYKPRTALVVKQTTIRRAKFPVIDVHFHMDYKADPAKVVQTMRENSSGPMIRASIQSGKPMRTWASLC